MASEKRLVKSHTDLDVYQQGFDLAMQLFQLSKSFPIEERYSLTDQVRRSSRSVSANIAEAWRKRRYVNSFVAKLSDSEAEAAETQTWIHFAVECGYLQRETGRDLFQAYEALLGKLVRMITNAADWTLPK